MLRGLTQRPREPIAQSISAFMGGGFFRQGFAVERMKRSWREADEGRGLPPPRDPEIKATRLILLQTGVLRRRHASACVGAEWGP